MGVGRFASCLAATESLILLPLLVVWWRCGPGIRARWGLALGVAAASLAAFETLAYLTLGVGRGPSFEATTCDAVRFDLVRGARWRPGRYRWVRVVEGQVCYDARFRVNAQGWPSQRDYHALDQPGVRRWAILGDSFTAAPFLETNWPDRVQTALGPGEPELLNLSLYGGGLSNWYTVFVHELQPHLQQLEAVVLACYLDDLHRRFLTWEREGDYLTFLRFPRPPRSRREFLARQRRCGLPMIEVHTEEALQARIEAAQAVKWRAPAGWLPVGRRLAASWNDWRCQDPFSLRFTDLVDRDARLDERRLVRRYGPRWWRLRELVASCRQQGVHVLLCAIPARDVALSLREGRAAQQSVVQQELSEMARLLGVSYFDGYRVFAGASAEEINGCYFVRDDHWNQQGSDRFAKAFLRWMTSSGWPGNRQ